MNIPVIIIGVLSALITVWRSGRTPIIMDYAYQMENAYRIFAGQIPYRDFVLVLTPGTYYISALVMKIFGTAYVYQVLLITLIQVLTVFITYRILILIGGNKILNVLLILPVIFTGHAIFAFPSYDMESALFALLGIYLLLRIHKKGQNGIFSFILAGIVIAMPPFFKQNTGLIFTVLALILCCIHIIWFEKQDRLKKGIILIGSTASVYVMFFLYLSITGSLGGFIFQTVFFPLRVRKVNEMALLNLLDIIRPRSLLYYIPFVVMAGLIMARKASNYLLMVISAYGAVISPVVYAVYLYLRFKPFVADMSFITGYVYLYLSTVFFAAILLFAIGTIREIANPNKKKREDLFRLSFSIVLVLYCLSPFYLHRVERASFNFYPILAMILSLLTLRLKHYLPQFRWHMIVGIIAVGTSIHLMIGLLQIEVIKLASAYGIISPQAVTLQQINKGLLTGAPPGPWNREVSDMVRYVQHNIPANDSLIAFPGDDPIHYLTGRKPVLPFFQFNPETLAHTTREYCGQIDREQVKWIVVRTHPQCYIDCAWPGEEEVKSYIITHYRLDKRINGYDIFRRL